MLTIFLFSIFLFFVLLLIIIFKSPPLRDNYEIRSSDMKLVFSNQDSKDSFNSNKKKLLTIYTQFKNESHILLEWINHYKQEGADHIFLVDNDSDDGYDVAALRKIPHLTLFHTKIRHQQLKIAEWVFKNYIEGHFEWASFLDMDEFLYSRLGYASTADYLRKLGNQKSEVKAILLPWKIFGSSGHIQQPKNVIHHFLYRDEDGTTLENSNLVKSLFKPSYYKVKMHMVEPLDPLHNRSPHAKLMGNKDQEEYSIFYQFDPNKIKLKDAPLHLNHYMIQSRDFFYKVKMKRGDATEESWNTLRNEEYFKSKDKNTIYDSELSIKKKVKKPDVLILDNFQGPDEKKKNKKLNELLQKIHSKVRNIYHLPTRGGDWRKGLKQHWEQNPNIVVVVFHFRMNKEKDVIENENLLESVLSKTCITGKAVFIQPEPGFPIFAATVAHPNLESAPQDCIYSLKDFQNFSNPDETNFSIPE